MDIKRILCPVDFSEDNHAANEYASVLAGATGSEIVYLHIYLPDVYETPPAHYDGEANEKELLEKLKEFIQPAGEGVNYSYVIDYGLAADRIEHYVEENDIDIVVMGTHGRTGLRRILMGSVAESVVRRVKCPVLAIKAGSEDDSGTDTN